MVLHANCPDTRTVKLTQILTHDRLKNNRLIKEFFSCYMRRSLLSELVTVTLSQIVALQRREFRSSVKRRLHLWN
jgi:hypothetical protein